MSRPPVRIQGEEAGPRWPWLPPVALACALAACYGTLLTVTLLSSLGIVIAIDDGAWAGVIAAFALLAAAGVGLGRRRHGQSGPLALALLGAAVLLWSQFDCYNAAVELGGFAALIAGAIWNHWAPSRTPPGQS